MTQHKMRAACPFADSDDGIEVEITFNFTRGRPMVRYLRNGDPGYPADPDEVEVVGVKPVDPALVLPANLQKNLDDWAELYLSDDEGHGRAVDAALDDRVAAREFAAELRRESREPGL